MSYEQSILGAPERQRSLLLSAISKALFDIPNGHRARLESIRVDELTYTSSLRVDTPHVVRFTSYTPQLAWWHISLLLTRLTRWRQRSGDGKYLSGNWTDNAVAGPQSSRGAPDLCASNLISCPDTTAQYRLIMVDYFECFVHL